MFLVIPLRSGGWKAGLQMSRLACETKIQGRRYLNLVPVIFHAEDGSGRNRDLCAQCWTEHFGTVSSGRSCRWEQAQLQKKEEGFRVARLGIVGLNKWCVESALRPQKRAEESFDVKERSLWCQGKPWTYKRITEVPYEAILKARATPCKEDRLEEEDLPQWTKKAIGPIWSQGLDDDDDDEARNVFCEELQVEECRSPQTRGWRNGRQWSNHVHPRLRALQAVPSGRLLVMGVRKSR